MPIPFFKNKPLVAPSEPGAETSYMENFQPGKLYRDADMLPGLINRVPQLDPHATDIPTVGREMPSDLPLKGTHPGTLELTPDQPEYWRERLKKLLRYSA